MAKFLISAAHKSSGKTTISIGLCAALTAQGRTVQPFKKGPDYIDPLWLGQASGRPCHNLDFYLSSHEEIQSSFVKHGRDSEIQLIEGNHGLYDGLDLEGSNSNAALAALLETPVILVIDVQGMTRGIAPLVLGYQQFDPNIKIGGIILNQVRGSRHESRLRAVLEHYTDVPVLGAVKHDPELKIVERHLGLMPSNENKEAEQKIRYIGERITQQIDLYALLEVAAPSSELISTDFSSPPPTKKEVRLGIARDAAFGFYYPGDLEALESAGAELLPFDTLKDNQLPDVDALFIGGGFPEVHMQTLSNNTAMREAIRDAIETGMPVYAECGGLMYLARKISWQGKTCEMVGVIPGDIEMHERPVGRGYTRLKFTGTGPWPIDETGSGKDEFAAHEFHYSSLENLDPATRFAYEVRRGTGIDGKRDGIVYKNMFASYVHLRDVDNNHWTRRFVEFIRQTKRQVQFSKNATG